jgi:hypothetical protein
MVSDAPGAITSELARMEKINANWSKARLMWLVSGLLGALLLNFVRSAPLALALMSAAAPVEVADFKTELLSHM